MGYVHIYIYINSFAVLGWGIGIGYVFCRDLWHCQNEANLTPVVLIHAMTIAHWCAAHGTFGCLLDAGVNAPVTAHIGQTSLEQDAPEGASEVLVEDGIDGRIERRVHVAKPEGDGERRFRYVAMAATCRHQDVQEEEGQPAGDEAAHDQAQN